MPPTRVPRCGALVVVVAVLAHPVPRLRRGRVPASATASGVRVVDVPASREPRRPRLRRACGRARAPRAVCSRRGSGARGARAPRAVCSSPACRASARRAAPAPRAPRWPYACVECVAPSPSERCGGRARDERAVCSCRACHGWPWPCARVERAVCSRRWSRARGPRAAPVVRVPCARVEGAAVAVPPSSERRSRPSSRRARVECAAAPRPRRACRAVVAPVVRVPRARARGAVVLVPVARVPCARRPSAAVVVLVVRVRCVLASSVPRSRRPSPECRASDERAAAPALRVPPQGARAERAAAPELSVRRCGARVEGAAVLALRVPRPCASVDGAAAHEPREPRGVPEPREPPCPRRGSGTLVPWAPCPNGGRAFAERAALIVSHR